jgi:hypothetical protein
MELSIYFSKLDYIRNIEEVLHPIDYRNIPTPIMDALFGEINSSEYYNNLVTLEYLQNSFPQEIKFSRLYFGQEFCQYLVPDLEEIRKAYYFSQQLDWDFTYVTGYLTDEGIEKIEKHLEFLAKEGKDIEVVVNDWGVLYLLHREFPSLHPVLGRLLIKQKRLGRFANTSPPINMNEIDASKEEIGQNQRRVLKKLNLSLPIYREELKRLGIKRIEVDIVPQGVDLEPKWGFSVSCYYPWTYLTCGRNCSTAAIDDPIREYVVVNDPCPKLCQTFNRTADVKQFPVLILQRGNTVFAFSHPYAKPYLKGDIPIDRLIFEPYIPI